MDGSDRICIASCSWAGSGDQALRVGVRHKMSQVELASTGEPRDSPEHCLFLFTPSSLRTDVSLRTFPVRLERETLNVDNRMPRIGSADVRVACSSGSTSHSLREPVRSHERVRSGFKRIVG
jgi:hypothetical protein